MRVGAFVCAGVRALPQQHPADRGGAEGEQRADEERRRGSRP